jgi:hypothetical protein
MSTTASTFYHQSSFKQIVRKLLPFFASVLPERLFNRGYALGFATYRLFLRLIYLRFLLLGVVTRDTSRIRKTLLVFKVMPSRVSGYKSNRINWFPISPKSLS